VVQRWLGNCLPHYFTRSRRRGPGVGMGHGPGLAAGSTTCSSAGVRVRLRPWPEGRPSTDPVTRPPKLGRRPCRGPGRRCWSSTLGTHSGLALATGATCCGWPGREGQASPRARAPRRASGGHGPARSAGASARSSTSLAAPGVLPAHDRLTPTAPRCTRLFHQGPGPNQLPHRPLVSVPPDPDTAGAWGRTPKVILWRLQESTNPA